MPPRRWPAVLVGALCLMLPSATQAGTTSPAAAGPLIGFDGLEYESAPLVVEGVDGELFLGLEFDVICSTGGARLADGMRRLGKLADVIERSGRRVVFTVAPSKSVIEWDRVVDATLPHGPCDQRGVAEQRRVLDRFPDSRYSSLLGTLDDDPRSLYWKTDPHWTTVGGAKWARQLAGELDPRLVRWQRYAPTTQTQLGFLNQIRAIEETETVPGLSYAGSVRVRTDPDSPYSLDPGAPYAMDHRWSSRPAARTWPGRTILVGDSFTLTALGLLRPLFRHGRFVWFGHISPAEIAAGIADADTVVLEVVQFFAVGSELGRPGFRGLVAQALARHSGRG